MNCSFLLFFGLFLYIYSITSANTVDENNNQGNLNQVKGKTVVQTAFLEVGDGCTGNGRALKVGEESKNNHIRYQCGSDRIMHPKGCFVGEKDLEPGEIYNNYEKNSYHECYRTDGKIGYREVYCGSLHPCQNFPESEKQKFQPKAIKFFSTKVERIPVPIDWEREFGTE
uniref:Abnormal cell migration protein 18-like fibronectin type I domain-containing protein n=1 Tax=Acrobeloides nanus TaxID=290746 RepID=A0A914CC59_9BILA